MPIKIKHTSQLDRTEELIIYIASKLQDKPNYGATLLGKCLCLIDSMSYLNKGKAISNLEYIKQERGPTPDPSVYLSVRDKLEITGELEKIEKDYFGRKQIRYIAKREAFIEVFSDEEIALISDVIESIEDINATDISDYTHTFIAWIFAHHKEHLPFYTFLLTSKEPDDKSIRWAEKSIRRYTKNNKLA